MSVFNSIFLGIISIVYFIFERGAFGESLYAWVMATGLHVLLYKTKRFRIIGFVYTVHAALFLSYTLNFMPDVLHGIEFFWMILFTLYTFFAIGKLQGYVVLFISFIGTACYFIFSFQENIRTLSESLETYRVTATVLNILVACILIAYMVNQFIQLNSYAETKFKAANLELQSQNRLVQAQNEEKTIMLKEIHHRVKNNLQVISSLLRLQSHEIKDKELSKHFQDAVNRVAAMALIHEKMYRNRDLSKIALGDYLRSLADELIEVYSEDIEVQMIIESDIRSLGNDTLVPVALIFNELISNSLKHAFTGVAKGMIKVKLRRISGSDNFEMCYMDSGNWSIKKDETSFGLELIEALTEQLEGQMKRSFTKGTRYDFILRDVG
jgi:two-component sensor histidine kinase